MADLNFPSNPQIGDLYSLNGKTYRWDGQKWQFTSGSVAYVTSGNAVTFFNGNTAGAQYFFSGTSGSSFGISSIGSSHTFNIPIAGAGATGLVSTLSQTFTGAKTFDSNLAITASTASSNTSTGALIVSGSVGVGQSVSIGGRLQIFNGANYTAFVSSASGNTVYTLPATSPATGTSVLQSDVAGVMSWVPMTATSSSTGTTAANINVVLAGTNTNHPLLFTPTSGTASGVAVSSNSTLVYNPSTDILTVSGLAVTAGTSSTSTSTGALIVTGGVGIGGTLYVGSSISVNSGSSGLSLQKLVGGNYGAIYSTGITPSATNYTMITDGAAVNFNGTSGVYFNISNTNKIQVTTNNINIVPTAGSTSTSTGAFTVAGGVGIGGSLYVASATAISGVTINNGTITGNLTGTATTSSNVNVVLAGTSASHPLLFTPTSGTASGVAVSSNSTLVYNPSTDLLSVSGLAITAGTGSSNATTGALVVTGGVGIGGSLNVTNKARFAEEVKLTSISSNALSIDGSGSVAYTWTVGTTLSSSRYNLGSDLCLVPVGGSQSALQTYWGLQLVGNNQTTPNAYSPTAVGARDAFGVLIPNQQAASVGLAVIGHASQTGDLQIWTTPSGLATTTLLSVRSNGQLYSYASIASTSPTTGALVVTGGVGIGGSLYVNGDLTINGTTTTINSVTLTVDDKNIELGSVASPSDVTAEGGGITLKGASDKSIIWYSGVGWSSTESWNLSAGQTYKISNTSVLSNSSLGTGVTNSSLTALGTITTGTWAGSTITAFYGGTGLQAGYAVGDILYANTPSTLGRLSAGIAGSVLYTAGAGTTPYWAALPTASAGTTAQNINVVATVNNTSHPILFTPTSGTASGLAVSSRNTIVFNPSTDILFTPGLAVTSVTTSISTSTGGLIVTGGVGIGGSLYVGGQNRFSGARNSTSTTSGTLVIDGGVGITGNAFIGGTINVAGQTLITSSLGSTNNTTGALVVTGGVGISGQLSFVSASLGFTGITYNPTMAFIGNTSSGPITLTVLTDNSLNFEGSQGSVFAIDSNLSSGEIFSVSDISGLPIISASAGQTVNINEFGGYTQIGNGSINSSSTNTGSLVVSGGLGVTGNTFIGGNTTLTSLTNSTTTGSGSLVINGGLGVSGNANIGGTVRISNGLNSSSTTSGSLIVNGGLGITGNAFIGGTTTITNLTNSSSTTSGSLVINGGLGLTGNAFIGGTVNVTNNAQIGYGSTTSGALVVTGGVGIGGSVYIGGQLGVGGTLDYNATGNVAYFAGNNNSYTQVIVHNHNSGNSASSDFIVSNDSATDTTFFGDFGMNSSGWAATTSAYNSANAVYLASNSGDLAIGSLTTNAIRFFYNNGVTDVVTFGGTAATIYYGTNSSSTTSGALQINGGLGITGNAFIGGTTYITNGTNSGSTGSGSLVVNGGLGVTGNAFIGGTTYITNGTNSGSIGSGSLVVNGGLGITGNAFIGGTTTITNLTNSTTTGSGSLVLNGGLGVSANANIGGTVRISNGLNSSSTTSGSLVVNGGLGITGNAFIGGTITITNGTNSGSTGSGSLVVNGGLGITGNAFIGGTTYITNTTASTSSSSGALTVSGGVGIGQTLFVGGNIVNANYFYSGGNNFTKSGLAQGDIILDNNTNDTPGVLYYYRNNTNFGIDAYAVGIGATRLRIVRDLNESTGAELWSIDRTGVVTRTAWDVGEVITSRVYNYTDLNMSATTTVGVASYVRIANVSYTPKSSSSYIWIEFSCTYDIAGAAADDFYSNITVNGNEIVYNRQIWTNGAGGGTRSGILFPISGRYTNSSTSGIAITVQAARGSSDDNGSFFGASNSGYMRITEIGR